MRISNDTLNRSLGGKEKKWLNKRKAAVKDREIKFVCLKNIRYRFALTLVDKHAYTVLKAAVKDREIKFVCLKNIRYRFALTLVDKHAYTVIRSVFLGKNHNHFKVIARFIM